MQRHTCDLWGSLAYRKRSNENRKKKKEDAEEEKGGEIRRNIFRIITIKHHPFFKAVKLGPWKNYFTILKMYGNFKIVTGQGRFNLLIYILKMKPHKAINWRIKDQLDVTILFHFLCAQHVSDINMSIIRSLRLFCWIITLVILFLVRCVLEIRCGWVGVVSVLKAEACKTDTTPYQPHRISNTHRTKNNTTNVVIQQNSRKLLMMDILMSETCWAHKQWNKTASDVKVVFYSSTLTMMHGPINIR